MSKDIISFECFEEMTTNWSRLDLLRRCYDLCNEMVEKQQEIERLKTELQDTKEHLGEYLYEQEEENKRLNNIINELERHLEQQWLEWKDCETDVRFMANEDKCILEKLRELKGSNNNE